MNAKGTTDHEKNPTKKGSDHQSTMDQNLFLLFLASFCPSPFLLFFDFVDKGTLIVMWQSTASVVLSLVWINAYYNSHILEVYQEKDSIDHGI